MWKLSFLLLSPPHQISCITPSGQALYLHMLHTVLVWTSTELFSTRCPTQKSPLHQHLFTSGLKLLQGGESQMGSVKGQQSHLLHTDANLFTSVPTFFMLVLTLALNYCNISQDFWVASTQSVTSITTYIINVFCVVDLSSIWGDFHDRESSERLSQQHFINAQMV